MSPHVETMRDIWDKEKGERRKVAKYKILPPELMKHYLDYSARKIAFLETKNEIIEAFADYEKKLGEAGFSKI